MHFSTRALHSADDKRWKATAVMPPIYMTSTFAQAHPGQPDPYDYTRAGNPNFTMLEETLAALEGGRHATVFSAGLGALTALLSGLASGSSVATLGGVYGGTFRLITRVFSHLGIKHLPLSDSASLQDTLSKYRPALLLFETPTNPTMAVSDIEGVCAMARRAAVKTVVDNTFATPYLQNPLALGADIVWHSTTKYIGGHSDVIGGVLIGNGDADKEAWDFNRMAMGLNPSPFDCWLTLRGVKTLALRMERHCDNADAIAHRLQGHPLVAKLYYPGVPTHDGHAVAKRQMRRYGGMLSVEWRLSKEKTEQLASSFKLIALAESLGGVESLVCHPATMTHASLPERERRRLGISDSLLRFSVGIEEVEDLLSDISNALERCQTTP